MTYIQECNPTDFIEYNEHLKKEVNLLDVQKATSINIKNLSSTPVLIIYKEKNHSNT